MPEIVFTNSGNAAEDRRTRRASAAGTLRQIAPRIYTSNLRDPIEAIVRRNVWQILGKLFPGTVISARSAASAQPSYVRDREGKETGRGYVFLTGPSRRSASLPGVEIRLASGLGPLPGDTPFQGLYLASTARHLLENLDRAQEIGADIVENNLDRAIEAWATTYAFVEAGAHARLTNYDPDAVIEWRDGVPAPRAYWEAMVASTGFQIS